MRLHVYIFILLSTIFTLQSQAATINWVGAGSGLLGTNSSDWYNKDNWNGGVIPGQDDDVQIGVTGFYFNPPVLNASTIIRSLTFGVATNTVSLTINSGVILTVKNNVSVKYGSNASTTINISGQTVNGILGGTITCNGSFLIGDNTAPVTPAPLGFINNTYTATVNLAIRNFNVAGSLLLNTTSSTGNVALVGTNISSNVNNPTLNINNGRLTVVQDIQETNAAYVNTALLGFANATNKAQLLVNPATNTTAGTTPTLSFGGSLSIATGGVVDFYGPGAGTSTLNYTGNTAQTVYTTLTGLDALPYTYQNVGFSGNGIKTVQAGTLNLTGNWRSTGGNVDVLTNSAIVRFRGTTQTLSDTNSNGGKGIVFRNVFFHRQGTKTISFGKFSVASTGVLNMRDTATLAVAANGTLTLISDAASSATVAALPLGTAITGNVNVQRFIKGSPTDLSKRGYRFITSAVYTTMADGIRCFDLRYLLDSAYVSGMTGGGFNAPSANPSLYLYRQDVVASNAQFTSGNFKGIAQITRVNGFDMGTQAQFTTSNVADTSINLPVGNGVLFFFRGNKANNATQSGSKVSAPYDFPEDVAFTQVGQLNTGTVNVRPWYKFDNTTNPNNYLPYTNLPAINNAANRGFFLVGNPYPSTINWEKFNRNGANSSIYGGGFPAASVTQSKIWVFNATSKQYDTYIQAPAIGSVADTTTTINPAGSIHTGDASNMIASGQGFFIRTTTTGQTLSFRETAKTNTQPDAANLIRLMNAPSVPAALSFSSVQTTDDAPVESAIPMLNLRLIKDSINTDDVVLAFNNHTPNTFNAADDAEDLHGNGALVSLSIMSSDNMATAIKRVMLPQGNRQVINLSADATASGRYQLKLKSIEGLPAAYNVWLKDAFTNDSLDFRSNDTYAFNIDKSNSTTFGKNRFKIIVSQNLALNMHALSFDAKKVLEGARLIWQTENEANDYTFVVERSTDNGKTFKDLGQLRSSGIGAYSFLDSQQFLGENHYRIRIENITNNKADYTAVISLNNSETTSVAAAAPNITIYPNPTSNLVNIKMDADESNSQFLIRISNSMGMVVKEITSSQPDIQQDVTNLLPGTYLVKVVNTTANKVQGETKFVKLN